MLSVTTTPTAPNKLDALADAMEADGFVLGKPAHVSQECIAIDRETAAEGTCDHCGHAGLAFVPYRPRCKKTRDYRGLAWCPCCEAAFEM